MPLTPTTKQNTKYIQNKVSNNDNNNSFNKRRQRSFNQTGPKLFSFFSNSKKQKKKISKLFFSFLFYVFRILSRVCVKLTSISPSSFCSSSFSSCFSFLSSFSSSYYYYYIATAYCCLPFSVSKFPSAIRQKKVPPFLYLTNDSKGEEA